MNSHVLNNFGYEVYAEVYLEGKSVRLPEDPKKGIICFAGIHKILPSRFRIVLPFHGKFQKEPYTEGSAVSDCRDNYKRFRLVCTASTRTLMNSLGFMILHRLSTW